MSGEDMTPSQGQGIQKLGEGGVTTDRELLPSRHSKKKTSDLPELFSSPSNTASDGRSTMKLSTETMEPLPRLAVKKQIGLGAATFILLGVAANPGMIALMPFVYLLVGIGNAYFLTIFSTYIQCASIYFILRSELNLGVNNYPDMAARLCGPRIKICFSILSCIALLGASVAATVFSRNVVHELVTSQWDQAPAVIQSHYFWVIIIAWLIIFPLLTCPRLGGLRQISFVATILPLLFCFVMFWGLINFPVARLENLPWFRYDLEGMVVAFTMIYYPTQIQLNVQHVFQEMKRPTMPRKMFAVFCSLILYYIPTIVVGTLGVLIFQPHEQELFDIENMFKMKFFAKTVPIQASGWLFLVTVLTMVLLLMMSFKLLLMDLLKKRCKPNCCFNVSLAAMIAFICTVLASAIKTTSLATRLIGGTLYPCMAVVFPSIFYLCSQRKAPGRFKSFFHKFHSLVAVFLICFIGGFALYGSVVVPMEAFS